VSLLQIRDERKRAKKKPEKINKLHAVAPTLRWISAWE